MRQYILMAIKGTQIHVMSNNAGMVMVCSGPGYRKDSTEYSAKLMTLDEAFSWKMTHESNSLNADYMFLIVPI